MRFWGCPEAIGSHERATVPLLAVAVAGSGARLGLPCASGYIYLGSHHVIYIGIIPAVDNEYGFKNPGRWVQEPLDSVAKCVKQYPVHTVPVRHVAQDVQ